MDEDDVRILGMVLVKERDARVRIEEKYGKILMQCKIITGT